MTEERALEILTSEKLSAEGNTDFTDEEVEEAVNLLIRAVYILKRLRLKNLCDACEWQDEQPATADHLMHRTCDFCKNFDQWEIKK